MISKLILTEVEASALEELARHHPYADVRPRGLGLLALAEGCPVPEIAHFLRISEQTVYEWFHNWVASGVMGILGGHEGGRHRILSDAMIDTAVAAARSHPLRQPTNGVLTLP